MKKTALSVLFLSAVLLLTSCDKEPPVFYGVPEYIALTDADSEYNYMSGITVTDTKDGELTHLIQVSDNVSYHLPGTYTVTYSVTDSNGNTTQANTRVTVKDTTPPVITLNSDYIEITENDNRDSVDWQRYIEAVDSVWGDITDEIKIDDSDVIYGTVGEDYVAVITSTDMDGNSSTAEIKVNILDTTAPVIKGTPESIDLSEADEEFDFLEGVTAYDKTDGDVTESLAVDTSNLKEGTEGLYVIEYSVADKAGNIARVQVPVKAADTTPPKIIGFKPEITFPDSMTEYDFAGFATAVDENDGDVTESLVIDASQVVFGTVGEYTVTYTAVDSKGNEAVETQKVIISDTSAPEINGVNLEIEIGYKVKEYDFAEGVTAFDRGDGDITENLEIKVDEVPFGQIGAESKVYYTVKDSTDAETSIVATVKIVDDIAPVITLSRSAFTSTGSAINFANYASADDEIDGACQVEVDASEVNYKKNGTYFVTFSAEDKSGNRAEMTAQVKVSRSTGGAGEIDTSVIEVGGGSLSVAMEHVVKANAMIKEANDLTSSDGKGYQNALKVKDLYTEASSEYLKAYAEISGEILYASLADSIFECASAAKSVGDTAVSLFTFNNIFSKIPKSEIGEKIDNVTIEYQSLIG